MKAEFKQKKPFFLVWNSSSGYTFKRHTDIAKAEAEALRLAEKHPENKFHVLVSMGRAAATTEHKKACRNQQEAPCNSAD